MKKQFKYPKHFEEQKKIPKITQKRIKLAEVSEISIAGNKKLNVFSIIVSLTWDVILLEIEFDLLLLLNWKEKKNIKKNNNANEMDNINKLDFYFWRFFFH